MSSSALLITDIDDFDRVRDKSLSIIHRRAISVDAYPSNIFRNAALDIIWDGFKDVTSTDVARTFAYMFFKIKRGIFVKIVDNNLVNFLPFNNARHWINEYSAQIQFPASYKADYVKFLQDVYSSSSSSSFKTIPPLNEWVADNARISFEDEKDDDDGRISILRDMFEQLCAERRLDNDIEFFINIRDYPILTRDSTEPYNHLYGSRDRILLSHHYDTYCPVMSMSSNRNKYADILIPTHKDWARVVYQSTNGKVTFPPKYERYDVAESDDVVADWNDKKSMAIFRGSIVGAGPDARTNPRLKAVLLGEKYPTYLDIGITKWNDDVVLRKYEFYETVRSLDLSEITDRRIAASLEENLRSAYKYILNIPADAASFALPYELSSGSVVLLTQSRWTLWINRFLKPFIHYVPVREDLSDLIEKIQWCRDNDSTCREIALSAKQFYDAYLDKNGVLDYLQETLHRVSLVSGEYEYYASPTMIEHRQQRVVDIDDDIKYNFASSSYLRSKPLLDGIYKAFHADANFKVDYVRELYASSTLIVDLVKYRGVYMARKRVKNLDYVRKLAEHEHENYIGIKSINEHVLRRCANFSYVFGLKIDNANGTAAMYTEYISGPTLKEWLASTDFDEQTYLNVLILLNLALIQAQNSCAFVHNDAFPDNVILEKLDRKIKFAYDFKAFAGKNVVVVETDILPIFIDYGKATTVVYDDESARIKESSVVNRFGGNRGIDCVSILASTFVDVCHKLSPATKRLVGDFVTPLRHELDYYSKYGTVLAEPYDMEMCTSDDFVTFLLVNGGTKYDFVNRKLLSDATTSMMMRNNALLVYATTIYRDTNEAFKRVLDHLLRSSVPFSDNYYINEMIKIRMRRRFDQFLRMKPETLQEDDDYYKIKALQTVFDDYVNDAKDMSMISLVDVSSSSSYIDGDWIDILSLFYDAKMTKPEIFDDYSLSSIVDVFDFLSSVAKINTTDKIKTVVSTA